MKAAKYWLNILNELKNRGVKDIFKEDVINFVGDIRK